MARFPALAAQLLTGWPTVTRRAPKRARRQTFGTGDVRGVIASESSNNAKEGGALVPTVAFGVPGSAGMAILLGAFMIHGLVPGPDMLSKNLHITYSMVWSIAMANILGAGLCYLFSEQFAKLATLRYTLILPTVLGIIYIGAFQGSRNWGDMWTLLIFGLLGWTMKQLKWPRPPLVLGLVLGDIIERYLFISIQRYGAGWMLRPIVMGIFVISLLGLLRPLIQDVKREGGIGGMLSGYGAPRFKPTHLMHVFMLCVFGYLLWEASSWNFSAKIVPTIVGTLGFAFVAISLLNEVSRREENMSPDIRKAGQERGRAEDPHGSGLRHGHLPVSTVAKRGIIFFAWLLAFMGSMATIGLIPTVPLFVILYMRLEGRSRGSSWFRRRLASPCSSGSCSTSCSRSRGRRPSLAEPCRGSRPGSRRSDKGCTQNRRPGVSPGRFLFLRSCARRWIWQKSPSIPIGRHEH